MAIICRSYNLLFIMTPRTACTAIGELLCDQLGGEFLPKEDIIDSKGFIRIQKKHSTLAELLQNNLVTATEVQSLLKFSAVRNPFDSLVSLYNKKRYKYQSLLSDPTSWVNRTPHYAKDMEYCKTHSFESWVMRTCTRKIIKRVIGFKPSMFKEYTEGLDMVMRFENLQRDLQDVLTKAGVSFHVSIPVVNRTDERKGTDYRAFYSNISRKFVEYAYAQDLKIYGYNF